MFSSAANPGRLNYHFVVEQFDRKTYYVISSFSVSSWTWHSFGFVSSICELRQRTLLRGKGDPGIHGKEASWLNEVVWQQNISRNSNWLALSIAILRVLSILIELFHWTDEIRSRLQRWRRGRLLRLRRDPQVRRIRMQKPTSCGLRQQIQHLHQLCPEPHIVRDSKLIIALSRVIRIFIKIMESGFILREIKIEKQKMNLKLLEIYEQLQVFFGLGA